MKILGNEMKPEFAFPLMCITNAKKTFKARKCAMNCQAQKSINLKSWLNGRSCFGKHKIRGKNEKN
jgi:hypothetical protein